MRSTKKDYKISVRVSEIEYKMLKDASKELGVSISEVIRRLLWTVVILYSDLLPAVKALTVEVRGAGSKRLADILKPLPTLFRIILEEAEKYEKKGVP